MWRTFALALLALVLCPLALSLRKVKLGELAMKLLRCLIIGTSSRFCRCEISKMDSPSRFRANATSPRSIWIASDEVNTLEPTGVIRALFSILTVLRIGTFSKITFSVIQGIVISVVNVVKRAAIHDYAVHEDRWSHIVFPACIKSLSQCGPHSLPFPLRKENKVLNIDYRSLSFRKWNQAVRLVKRLNDLVAFHGGFHRCTSNALRFSRYFSIIALLFLAPFSYSQTTVSGTITDVPDGQAWFGGTFYFTFRVSPSSPTGPYFNNGVPFSIQQTVSGTLDGSGHYSVSVPSNSSITPSGSTWDLTVCPQATSPCFTQQSVIVTGATLTVSPTPPSIRINMGSPPPTTRAYTDTELVAGVLGQQYFNLVSAGIRICSTLPCGWTAISFSGTLPVSQGGTGNISNANHGVLIGENFNPISAAQPTGNSQCLLSAPVNGTTTDPAFSNACGLKPALPNDPIQYVSANGNDANDGLSWGSAKLTVYAALLALPGGSAGVAGYGTVLLSGTVAYGGPAANQGMWIMGGGDANFASPPSGWLKKITSNTINIECAFPLFQTSGGHTPACSMTGGGNTDLVHPAIWLSSTTGINFKNIGLSNFLNTYIKVGIDSNNNRAGTGGTSSISFDGVAWNHGLCRFGGGPGMDIGLNSFWIWIQNITGTGCDFGELSIAAPGSNGLVRLANVVTVNLTAPSSITAGANQWITITNATDPSFNGSFVVQSAPSSTQFTYNQIGPNATSGNGQVVTAAKAAINNDSGGGTGGSGLIFIDRFQINSGNIRYVNGTNGGGFYVRNGDYEGDGSSLDAPIVLVVSGTTPTNIVVDNVEISDPSTPIPGVQVDNFTRPVVIVSRVDAGVKGPATLLQGTQPYDQTITMTKSGQAGFDTFGRLSAGGIDVARRLFGPVSVVSPNLAATNPTSWTYVVGAGTITSNFPSPDSLTNAGHATSNSGLSIAAFYQLNNTPLVVGDAYIYGVWQRVNSGSGTVAFPRFSLQNGGFGNGDTCATGAASTLFPSEFSDGQWIWMSGICKIYTAPVNAGILFAGDVNNPQTIDFYGPTLIKIPAGTKSDDELYEIALNLMPYNPAAAAGDVSLFTNQPFRVNGPIRSVQQIADQGTACTNGELALSAGWQSTGAATVTAVAGNGQTCSWTITTGTTTAANPTVADTLTNVLPAATTVCELNIHGGSHTPAAGEGFTQTALSATTPIFTFIGTPTAGGTTYFVTRRCGP